MGSGHRPGRAFGHAFIDGNLGLAGIGNLLIGGHATVGGDVYGRSSIVLTIGHAVIAGTIFYDKTLFLTIMRTKRWPRPPTPSA